MKICLIGNYSKGQEVSDGQRCKVRLYYDILINEGFDVELIDLALIKKHFLKILFSIKKSIKECDVVILMTANRGAKILLPLVNHFNAKEKKRLVFPLIGTSVLHEVLDKMTETDASLFLHSNQSKKIKPNKRTIKNLSKIDAILSETETITRAFSNHYQLNNVFTITNFRLDFNIEGEHKKNKAIFISRVNRMKGIFDAVQVFSKKKNWELDIYGPLDFSKHDAVLFNQLLQINNNIKYMGIVEPKKTIDVISQYSLLVFPTKYITEGTPGVLVESLLAETPILCSSFLQCGDILSNNIDSLVFQMNNDNDFLEKLNMIDSNDGFLQSLARNCRKTKQRYTYSYNRTKFLTLIVGDVK